MKRNISKHSSFATREAELRAAALGLQIRQFLNTSTDAMAPDIVERLRVAREHALDRQKQPDTIAVLAYAGGPTQIHHDFMAQPKWKSGLAWLISALMLTAALLFVDQWQQAQQIDELAEIDALILADDLPLDAHLDPGFVSALQPHE